MKGEHTAVFSFVDMLTVLGAVYPGEIAVILVAEDTVSVVVTEQANLLLVAPSLFIPRVGVTCEDRFVEKSFLTLDVGKVLAQEAVDEVQVETVVCVVFGFVLCKIGD